MAGFITWGILGVISLGSIVGAAWMAGYFKNQEQKQRAREQAELERLRADAKAREAGIYAKPKPDTWRGTTKRL